MTTPPVRLLALLVSCFAFLLLPASANAAAETYVRTAWADCGTATTGGQYDEARNFYISCGTGVWVKRPGIAFKVYPLGIAVQDVAPSPQGHYLYAIGGGTLIRFDRRIAADGTWSYVRNLNWKLPANITTPNWVYPPSPVAVGTDGRGQIYVSHNGLNTDNVITKHTPAGAQVTVLGGFIGADKSELGKFYLARGVAPSRDGRYVYVVEKTGGLIERWDYQVDGTYKATLQKGRYTLNGSCINGEFGAPGDVVVDPWGFVYIMDTTCARIQKFTAAFGFVWSKSVLVKSHRLAVDSYGSVYTAEGAKQKLVRAAADAPTATMPALQPLPEPPFVATNRAICPVEDWTNGAGQAAKDGTVYVACGHSIYAAESNGTQLGRIAMPDGAHYYDVAPSPDETYLYVTRRVDGGGPAGRAELRRFVRTGAAGSLVYTLDANWKLADIVLGGRPWKPQGQFVATDVWGDIYFSNGGWSGYYTGAWDGDFTWEPSPAVVVKYDPAGAIKTQVLGQQLGEFDVNMGLTVSRDGRTIWTVEHKAARVQRFDFQPNGEYRQTDATISFGGLDAACATVAGFSTPYDIGADPWGRLWVVNTGCRRLEQYDATGRQLASVPLGGLAHGVAVDLTGGAWVGQRNLRLVRGAQNPVPGPVPVPQPLPAVEVIVPPVGDAVAPAITDVIVPAVTTTQAFTFEIRATDAVGITGMRLSREDGNWMAWGAYDANPTHTSSAGYGAKGVYVQLRDAAGNESAVVYKAYRFEAVAPPVGVVDDVTAPAIAGVVVPAVTTTQAFAFEIRATDANAITGMRLAREDGNWMAWGAYSANPTHTSSAGYGPKGVYVQLRDAAGNESAVVYRTYRFEAVAPPVGVVDATAPVLQAVTIPNPAPTRDIVVTTTAIDDVGVAQMRFANEDGNWGAWVAYAAAKPHHLSDAVSTYKGVYVQVRDAAGRESNVIYRTTVLG